MGTSGLMSGDGKRGGRSTSVSRAHPRLYRHALAHGDAERRHECRRGTQVCVRHGGRPRPRAMPVFRQERTVIVEASGRRYAYGRDEDE